MTVRRIIGAAAAAAAITLVPTAAFATYGDAPLPETVEPGETFSVAVDGPVGTEEVILTISSDGVPDSAIQIAGTQSLAKPADAQGDATFSVTLNEEATYSVVAEADGEVLWSDTIVVADEVAGDDDTDGSADGDGGAGAALPDTGATSTPLVVGAAALLAAGAGALLFARRQQQA